MSTISTDYSGRKVDLSIFPDGVTPNVPVEASLGFAGKVVSGPLAIAQAFAVALLTPLGHYKSDPDFGSTLIEDLSSKKIEMPSDILHAFALSSIPVVSYLDSARQDAPDDERIDAVRLESYNISGSVIELTIVITTLAGQSATFLLPVQWTL